MIETQEKGLSLKQNILWNTFGSVVYFACQWLLTIVVAQLDQSFEAAGVVALAMAVYNMFAPLALYKMYTYQISDIAHENSTGEYLSFRIISCTVAFVLSGIYTIATCSPTAFVPIMLFILSKLLSLIIDVFHGCDQLNNRMDYVGISLALQGVLSLTAFSLLFKLTQSLSTAFMSMSLVIALVGGFFDYPRTQKFENIRLDISRAKALHLLNYCFPIVIAAVAAASASSIVRQYYSTVHGEVMLGIYASIAAPTTIIQVLTTYIYNPQLTVLVEHFQEKHQKPFFGMLRKNLFIMGLVGVVSTVLVAIFGRELLIWMFGTRIQEHLGLLVPAIVMMLASAMFWFANDLLIGIRQFEFVLLASCIALIISVVGMVPAISYFGANGISYTGVVSYLVAFVFMMVRIIGIVRQRAVF